MPRALRCYLPGYVWHITHRCHGREFLLRAARDRTVWRKWLLEATRRYGLCVLNYVATSNHVHLLIHDSAGDGRVSAAMQLLEGQAAQAYNRRVGRHGAFWEDRHHAVAVETGSHLWRCLIYIDLNMVRAGAVEHPRDWIHGGYHELQGGRKRYRVLDLERLAELLNCATVDDLCDSHCAHVEAALRSPIVREPIWTESIAVGSKSFVTAIEARFGLSGDRVRLSEAESSYVLKEESPEYFPPGHA
ncbi:MAG: transposase [Chromatiales bacterium]|nr:transposase [Chromatiales bacterium]